MGRPKQLLLIPDRPALRRCAESLIAGGAAEVIVIIAGYDGIAGALNGLQVRVVRNRDPDSDMAGSARTGLQDVCENATGVLVCPADHPLVSPDTVRLLLAEHAAAPDRIIIPVYNERRGHPTLFPRPVISELRFFPTLRDLIRHNADRVRLRSVADQGVILDMDTPADYEKLTRLVAPTSEKTGPVGYNEACPSRDSSTAISCFSMNPPPGIRTRRSA